MIDLTTMKNNREKAIALINEGGTTKESLMADLGINDKSLASLFSQLRLMGHFNLKNEDGTYRLGTAEEYEDARPKGNGKKAEPRTPEQVLEAAEKRESKAASAATNAAKRYNDNPTRENELRTIIAEADLELASILLGKAQGLVDAAPTEPEDSMGSEQASIDIM